MVRLIYTFSFPSIISKFVRLKIKTTFLFPHLTLSCYFSPAPLSPHPSHSLSLIQVSATSALLLKWLSELRINSVQIVVRKVLAGRLLI